MSGSTTSRCAATPSESTHASSDANHCCVTPSNSAPGSVEAVVLLVAEQWVVQLGDVLEQRAVVMQPVVVELGELEARVVTEDADHRHPRVG